MSVTRTNPVKANKAWDIVSEIYAMAETIDFDTVNIVNIVNKLCTLTVYRGSYRRIGPHSMSGGTQPSLL